MWLERQALFTVLTRLEQHGVHEVFMPDEDLDEEEFDRRVTTRLKDEPQLELLAIDACTKLTRVHMEVLGRAGQNKIAYNEAVSDRSVHTTTTRTARHSKKRQLRVSAVYRPRLDIEKMASAIVSLAEHLAEQEEQKASRPPDTTENKPKQGSKTPPADTKAA